MRKMGNGLITVLCSERFLCSRDLCVFGDVLLTLKMPNPLTEVIHALVSVQGMGIAYVSQ